MNSGEKERFDRIKFLESKIGTLQDRVNVLNKLRVNLIEMLSRSEPKVFKGSPFDSGNIFKWAEQSAAEKAKNTARDDLRILEGLLDETYGELAQLRGTIKKK